MSPEPVIAPSDPRHQAAYRSVLDYCSEGVMGIGPFEAEELVRLVEREFFPEPVLHYRVVSVDQDGNQTATVPFESRDYAEKLWLRANTIPSVARCWFERRGVGDWTVCSSETGAGFMAMRPASLTSPRTDQTKEDR